MVTNCLFEPRQQARSQDRAIAGSLCFGLASSFGVLLLRLYSDAFIILRYIFVPHSMVVFSVAYFFVRSTVYLFYSGSVILGLGSITGFRGTTPRLRPPSRWLSQGTGGHDVSCSHFWVHFGEKGAER